MQVPGVFPDLPVRQNLPSRWQYRFAGPELTREVDRLLTLVESHRQRLPSPRATGAWPEAMA